MEKTPRCKNYSVINQRIYGKMQEKNLNITDLANEAGLSIGTVQKLVTDPACNPTIASLQPISEVLGTSIGYLIGQDKNPVPTESYILLNWNDLDVLLHTEDPPSHRGFNKDHVITTYPNSNTVFALKMADNSMVPLFPDGSILVFDKQKEYQDNSYILLYLQESNKFVFKQLLINEPYQFIRSINPMFKDQLIKLDPDDKIVATLVQSQLQF